MPRLPRTGLLRRSTTGIIASNKTNTSPPTPEKAMILFTSSTQNIAAPVSGGRSFGALVREMLTAWLAHHQRLADLGISGDL